jgi:hypothetical protein
MRTEAQLYNTRDLINRQGCTKIRTFCGYFGQHEIKKLADQLYMYAMDEKDRKSSIKSIELILKIVLAREMLEESNTVTSQSEVALEKVDMTFGFLRQLQEDHERFRKENMKTIDIEPPVS